MSSERATIFRTPTASDTVLAEVVRRLVEAYRPERIYLFGSVARGDANPNSDYDIMVVVPDDASPDKHDCDLAYRTLRGLGIAKDVWYGHEPSLRSGFISRHLFRPPFCERANYCMPLDPVRTVDARAWFSKAAQDLRRVEILIAAQPPDPEGALFHSQQAAEKAIKGFLTWHDVPFRRVHEIDEIGEQCANVDSSLADLMRRAEVLTKYAWRFRYPGAPYEPTLEEGRTAYNLACEVKDAILSRLPHEIRP